MKKAKAVKVTLKKTKKTTSVVVHTNKPETEMVWSNASQIMTNAREDIKTAVAQQMMSLATAVYKLPPQGITILANQPYINKTGWKMKMREYHEDKYRIRTEWKHLADPSEKYAICEAIIEVKDSKGNWDEVSRAIGEATEASIKLQAVKQTLNMMAETRAKNRAMAEFIGARALEDAVKTLNIMRNKNEVSSDQVNVISGAAGVTAEEMNAPETRTVDAGKAFSFVEKLKVELFKRGAKTARQAIEMVNEVTNAQLSSIAEVDENTAKQALIELSNQPIKRK
jgi:predicted translin family RNA/ssDNA-binding protein